MTKYFPTHGRPITRCTAITPTQAALPDIGIALCAAGTSNTSHPSTPWAITSSFQAVPRTCKAPWRQRHPPWCVPPDPIRRRLWAVQRAGQQRLPLGFPVSKSDHHVRPFPWRLFPELWLLHLRVNNHPICIVWSSVWSLLLHCLPNPTIVWLEDQRFLHAAVYSRQARNRLQQALGHSQ